MQEQEQEKIWASSDKSKVMRGAILLLIITMLSGSVFAFTGSPTAYYELEETGFPYEDSSANNYDISGVTAATRQAGADAYGQEFSNSWGLLAPYNATTDMRNRAWTINYWVNFDNVDNDHSFLSTNCTSTNGYNARFNAANVVWRDGTYSTIGFNMANYVDEWHMMTFVADSSNTQVDMYVNGIERGSATLNQVPGATETCNWVIGGAGYLNGTFNGFDGRQDEWMYFSQSLNSTEVSDLYNNGIGIFYQEIIGNPGPSVNLDADLEAYWTLDQDGGPWTDSTGNGNTATSAGGYVPTQVSGKLGFAQGFQGAEYIDSNMYVPNVTTSGYSLSSWVLTTEDTDNRDYFGSLNNVSTSTGNTQSSSTSYPSSSTWPSTSYYESDPATSNSYSPFGAFLWDYANGNPYSVSITVGGSCELNSGTCACEIDSQATGYKGAAIFCEGSGFSSDTYIDFPYEDFMDHYTDGDSDFYRTRALAYGGPSYMTNVCHYLGNSATYPSTNIIKQTWKVFDTNGDKIFDAEYANAQTSVTSAGSYQWLQDPNVPAGFMQWDESPTKYSPDYFRIDINRTISNSANAGKQYYQFMFYPFDDDGNRWPYNDCSSTSGNSLLAGMGGGLNNGDYRYYYFNDEYSSGYSQSLFPTSAIPSAFSVSALNVSGTIDYNNVRTPAVTQRVAINVPSSGVTNYGPYSNSFSIVAANPGVTDYSDALIQIQNTDETYPARISSFTSTYTLTSNYNVAALVHDVDFGVPGAYLMDSAQHEQDIDGYFSINDNNWHNLVITYDASTNIYRLYVDGRLAQSINDTTIGTVDTNLNYFMGALNNAGSSTNYYIGNLDEVGIWDSPLNRAEANCLYNNNAGLPFNSFSTATSASCSAGTTPTSSTGATFNVEFPANVTGNLTYNDANTNIQFNWNDLDLTTSKGEIEIEYLNGTTWTTITTDQTGASGTINYNASTPANFSTDPFRVNAYIYDSSRQKLYDGRIWVASLTVNSGFPMSPATFGTEGLFWGAMITIALITMGLYNPVIAVTFGILGLTISNYFGFLALSGPVFTMILVLAGVVVWRMRT